MLPGAVGLVLVVNLLIVGGFCRSVDFVVMPVKRLGCSILQTFGLPCLMILVVNLALGTLCPSTVAPSIGFGVMDGRWPGTFLFVGRPGLSCTDGCQAVVGGLVNGAPVLLCHVVPVAFVCDNPAGVVGLAVFLSLFCCRRCPCWKGSLICCCLLCLLPFLLNTAISLVFL